jgi:hypothetical protein
MTTLYVDNIAPNLQSSVAIPGHVIQVVTKTNQTPSNTYINVNATSYVDVLNMSESITPSSATSKILVTMNFPFIGRYSSAQYQGMLQVLRGATQVWECDRAIIMPSSSDFVGSMASITFVDSPSTTSSITYKLQAKSSDASGILRIGDNSGLGVGMQTATTLTLMEIAG